MLTRLPSSDGAADWGPHPGDGCAKMATVVRAFGQTDPGLFREANQDAFGLANLSTAQRWDGGEAEWETSPSGVLLVVSDGMGGANAGEIASALSVEAVITGMIAAALEGHPDAATLRDVVERASRTVYEAGQRPDRKGMGATLTAVVIRGACAYIAQIGDSRAYLLRDGQIGQVTHDQSYVQMLVDAGMMTLEEASISPRRSVILQVMGQAAVRVVLGRVDLCPGDRMLLCSDGLTNVLDDATLNALAKAPRCVKRACADLVARTLEGGAPDNVTVIVADVA